MKNNSYIWNFTQAVRAAAWLPPRGCQCQPKTNWSCEPGQTFKCDRCRREMPYCMGCDDDQFDSCDDCWIEKK